MANNTSHAFLGVSMCLYRLEELFSISISISFLILARRTGQACGLEFFPPRPTSTACAQTPIFKSSSLDTSLVIKCYIDCDCGAILAYL